MNVLSEADIKEYGKMISVLSNRIISKKEIAQEAAQEVWIEVIKSMPSFRNASKLSTWIYTIAKRVIFKYAKNEKIYSLSFLHDFLYGDDVNLPNNIEEKENEIWIKKECDNCLTGLFHCLTNESRMIYLFRDVIQLQYKEIAEIMDRDEQYVRKTVSRSRGKLKNFLNRECRIYNTESKCKCRMNKLIESINLTREYQKIRDMGKHISFLRQAEMILPSKNYWDKFF